MSIVRKRAIVEKDCKRRMCRRKLESGDLWDRLGRRDMLSGVQRGDGAGKLGLFDELTRVQTVELRDVESVHRTGRRHRQSVGIVRVPLDETKRIGSGLRKDADNDTSTVNREI